MIEQPGRVIATQGRFAWVETQRHSACGECSAQSGCGAALLDKAFGQRSNRIEVYNDIDLDVGEAVIVGVHETALLKGSAAAYLLPILLMLAGAIAGALAVPSASHALVDVVSLGAGLAGLGAGLAWVRGFGRTGGVSRYRPQVLRRGEAATVTCKTD